MWIETEVSNEYPDDKGQSGIWVLLRNVGPRKIRLGREESREPTEVEARRSQWDTGNLSLFSYPFL